MQNKDLDENSLRLLGIPPIQMPTRPLIASWAELPPRAKDLLREGEQDHEDAIGPGEVRIMDLRHIRSGKRYTCEVSYLAGALVVKTLRPAA